MQATALVLVFMGSINQTPTLLCNARDLHAFLKVGRRFATWITQRIAEYGFLENQDFAIISRNGEIVDHIGFPDSGNQKTGRGGDRRSKDYHLTLDTAKELAMVERTEQGRAVRRYFIDCERQLQAKASGKQPDAANLERLRTDLLALRNSALTVANQLRPLIGRPNGYGGCEITELATRAHDIALSWQVLGVGSLSGRAVVPAKPHQVNLPRLLTQQYSLPTIQPEAINNLEAMRRRLQAWAQAQPKGFTATNSQLAIDVLGLDADSLNQGQRANIGRVMRELGWQRVHAGAHADSYYAYQKPRF